MLSEPSTSRDLVIDWKNEKPNQENQEKKGFFSDRIFQDKKGYIQKKIKRLLTFIKILQ